MSDRPNENSARHTIQWRYTIQCRQTSVFAEAWRGFHMPNYQLRAFNIVLPNTPRTLCIFMFNTEIRSMAGEYFEYFKYNFVSILVSAHRRADERDIEFMSNENVRNMHVFYNSHTPRTQSHAYQRL